MRYREARGAVFEVRSSACLKIIWQVENRTGNRIVTDFSFGEKWAGVDGGWMRTRYWVGVGADFT